MKFSFCTIGFRHKNIGLEDIIYIISKCGYDGIEIWGHHLKGYETSLQKLKSLLNFRKLEVPMISPYFDFTGSYKVWCKSIETAKQMISIAYGLNCPMIRCFTGNIGSEFATQKERDKCVDGIRYIARLAKEKNITIAIETHPNTLADTIDSTLDLLNKIEMENVKILLDFYNLYEIIPDIPPLKILEIFYPHVAHIHAKNTILPDEKISPFRYVMDNSRNLTNIRYLSKGDINYSLILNKLQKNGYKGFTSIECFETQRNPIRVAEDEILYLRTLNQLGSVSINDLFLDRITTNVIG